MPVVTVAFFWCTWPNSSENSGEEMEKKKTPNHTTPVRHSVFLLSYKVSPFCYCSLESILASTKNFTFWENMWTVSSR